MTLTELAGPVPPKYWPTVVTELTLHAFFNMKSAAPAELKSGSSGKFCDTTATWESFFICEYEQEEAGTAGTTARPWVTNEGRVDAGPGTEALAVEVVSAADTSIA